MMLAVTLADVVTGSVLVDPPPAEPGVTIPKSILGGVKATVTAMSATSIIGHSDNLRYLSIGRCGYSNYRNPARCPVTYSSRRPMPARWDCLDVGVSCRLGKDHVRALCR